MDESEIRGYPEVVYGYKISMDAITLLKDNFGHVCQEGVYYGLA